jgi:hypothetical protein
MFVVQVGRCPRAVSLLLLLALVSFGVAGCQPQTSSANERPALPSSAAISFCATGPSACVPGADFSLASTRDLAVKTSIDHVAPGQHTQILEITMPDGRQYQETKLDFRIPEVSNAPVSSMRTIPIAGTWIQTGHVTGVWKVRYSLDGKLLATSDFRIEP